MQVQICELGTSCTLCASNDAYEQLEDIVSGLAYSTSNILLLEAC